LKISSPASALRNQCKHKLNRRKVMLAGNQHIGHREIR